MKRGRLILSMIVCLFYMMVAGPVAASFGIVGAALVSPHMLFMFLAFIFNIVAIGIGYGWPCTTATWLYVVAMVTGVYLNVILVIPCFCMILCATAINKTPEQLALESEAQKVYVVNQQDATSPNDEDKPTLDDGGSPILYNANGIFVMAVGARMDKVDGTDNEYNLQLFLSARNNNSEPFIVESGYAYVDRFGRVPTDMKCELAAKSTHDGWIYVRIRYNEEDGRNGIRRVTVEVNAYPVSGGYADNFASCDISGSTINRFLLESEGE